MTNNIFKRIKDEKTTKEKLKMKTS